VGAGALPAAAAARPRPERRRGGPSLTPCCYAALTLGARAGARRPLHEGDGELEERPIPEDQPVVSFIVPALDEALNLPPLFERLRAVHAALGLPCEILVVDDASTDDTLAVARAAGGAHPEIRALHKPLPHGLGRAVRAGIEQARGRVGIVVMADGVDPLEEAVPQLCQRILRDGCQLALLTRYTDPRDAASIPSSYRILHRLFRLFTSRLLGLPYADTTYAFRGFDLDYVRRLGLRSTGFELSPEITFRTHFAGGRIGEVAGRQTRRVRGKSNFRFTRVAPGYARVLGEACLMRVGLGRPLRSEVRLEDRTPGSEA
jgi:glycosyltransferase involved in cell wall biosynthesis